MVDEMRAQWAELDARRHFTPEKQPISDTRAEIRDALTPTHVRAANHTVSSLKAAASNDLFEVG